MKFSAGDGFKYPTQAQHQCNQSYDSMGDTTANTPTHRLDLHQPTDKLITLNEASLINNHHHHEQQQNNDHSSLTASVSSNSTKIQIENSEADENEDGNAKLVAAGNATTSPLTAIIGGGGGGGNVVIDMSSANQKPHQVNFIKNPKT